MFPFLTIEILATGIIRMTTVLDAMRCNEVESLGTKVSKERPASLFYVDDEVSRTL